MAIIKNIFFDYGRTLVEHPGDGAGLEIVISTGLKDERDVKLVRDTVFAQGKYLNRLDEDSLERDEYKRLVIAEVPERLHSYVLKAADYHVSLLKPIPGMIELLGKLKNDGYRLYITSNMDLLHSSQIKKMEIAKFFDGMIFSSEIKVIKPAKEFYEAALEKFGVKPEETLFIDDLKENIEGAKKCGIDGLVFEGNAFDAEQFIYNYDKGDTL